MRVSWNWLKELVDFDGSPDEIAQLLTMSGIEVDAVVSLQKGTQGIVVGLIKDVAAHPDAERLKICHVEIAAGKILTIVSGAPKLEAGMKVPLAIEGAVLANGLRIEKTNFRGIDSEGMLCSAMELGLDTDKLANEEKEGLYILPGDVEIGMDIVSLLGLDDIILELGLTPNRADCWGMINVAREVAALTGGKLKLPLLDQGGAENKCVAMTSVEILEPELCRRYVAKIIQDIKISKSPLWLRSRLLAVGVRPINNIVDITNYVMFEMGQPLHAFDLDKLAEKRIIVRRGISGEEMVTLDGQKRVLNQEMLIIADAVRPVAIAGVMGGLETEVTEDTKTILLEAAFFNGPNIRRTSLALGLRSEASQRFEKEVDLEQADAAADRAAQLMTQLKAGISVPGNVDCYPNPEKREPIKLRLDRINHILGTALQTEEIDGIMNALKLNVINKDSKQWTVVPPSYRRDLVLEIDLIEEVARLYGYDKIPTTLPEGPTTQGARTWEQKVRSQTTTIMSMQGLYQVLTFSFVNPKALDLLCLPENHPLRDAVVVANPLSEEQGVMRTTIAPGLLEVVRKNFNKRNKNLAIYELGKTYHRGGFPGEALLPNEKYVLAAAATGYRDKTWAYPAVEYDFYYLKGVLENLFSRLGISNQEVVYMANGELPFLHPGRSAKIIVCGKECGWLGEVHPSVLENFAIEQKTTLLALEMDVLTGQASESIAYQAITKYPAVTRDLAVIVPEAVEAAAIMALIKDNGQPLLKKVRLFDLYQGKQIEEGYKSLAFSLTWQADERTMIDEEVNELHHVILAELAAKLGGQLRA